MELKKIVNYSAEIPAVISLIERTYSKDRKLARNEVHSIVNDPQIYGQMYVLWADGEIVGTITYGAYFNNGWDGDGLISYLAVHPDHRRKGYARFMVNYAIEDMKAQKLPCVAIAVGQENVVARKFWENFDFQLYARNHKSNGSLFDCYAIWLGEEDGGHFVADTSESESE